MKYKVLTWCEDCTDIDYYGCFDGGTELSEETFDTKEGAEAFIDAKGPGPAPWVYEVVPLPNS